MLLHIIVMVLYMYSHLSLKTTQARQYIQLFSSFTEEENEA